MAFDACMMRAVLTEIRREMPDARIEKVLQPQNDELDLILHSGKVSRRLILNAGPNAPRIQLSDSVRENPLQPPMFCMLMRKHLLSARITDISQLGFDRIAVFSLTSYDDMGFPTEKKLVCEIMGKYANIILLDAEDKILAALKVIDFSASTVRQVLPGLRYQIPAVPDKISPLDATRVEFSLKLAAFPQEKTVEKFITSTYLGIATQIAHELSFRATGAVDTPLCSADPGRLADVFFTWQTLLLDEAYTPTVALDRDGAPVDYSYMPIGYSGTAVTTAAYPSFAALFDMYFAERDRLEKLHQRGHDLQILLNNAEHRTKKKLEIQRETLLACAHGEEYKKYGDLITSNIYRIRRGDTQVACVDYTDSDCPTVEVPLDARLSPAQNAQKQYKQYNKAKKAREILTGQIAKWEEELRYLDSVRTFLDTAATEQEIIDLRDELYRSGYAAKMKGYRPQKPGREKYLTYRTSGGYPLLVGRNNLQNDALTFRTAAKGDLWFHVKDQPGSHVILVAGGEEPSERDYTEAAACAAYYSKARGDLVAVDYTRVKNIKKPVGAKPGFVIYHTNYTAYVRPGIPKG